MWSLSVGVSSSSVSGISPRGFFLAASLRICSLIASHIHASRHSNVLGRLDPAAILCNCTRNTIVEALLSLVSSASKVEHLWYLPTDRNGQRSDVRGHAICRQLHVCRITDHV